MTGTISASFKGARGDFTLDAAFDCPGQGVTGLFGPSGSGKTTVLRCLAGLTRLSQGYLSVNGDVWQDETRFMPPHERPVGYVFQDARLFPHLSVRRNLEYGLKRAARSTPKREFDDVVALLGIAPLLSRSIENLSGGERQRVAIGRALLTGPRVLLMDEPLSALDRQSKADIVPYLEQMTRALSLPVIYVSHDLSEIERLADHLVLMDRQGRVAASGQMSALMTDLTLPLARLPHPAALLTMEVVRYDGAYDLTEGLVGGVKFFVPGKLAEAGANRRIRVEARDVSLVKGAPAQTSVLNVIPARIKAVEPLGANQILILLELDGTVAGTTLLSSITRLSWDRLELATGSAVLAQIKSMALADAD